MYLTRIDIDTHRRESRRVLASPHRMHGAIGTCFPPSRQPTRPLWRIDETRAGTFLYVLSDVEPDPTGFVERHGWPRAQAWVTRDYAPVLDAVETGRSFSFRCRINPVRHIRDSDAPPSVRGRRVGHVTADQQLRWFARRAADWGFSVGDPEDPAAAVVDRTVWRFDRSGRQVTVATAAVEGTLTIADSEIVRRALIEGIGPAKAYGCGLLTLAPVR